VRYEACRNAAPEAVSQTEALEWSAILRSCSAWDAYKSIHGAEVIPAGRRVSCCSTRIFRARRRFCVSELNAPCGAFPAWPRAFCNDAEKLAGRLEAELQFSTVEEIFDQGLHSTWTNSRTSSTPSAARPV
jgi:uncharacterized alpha-E superfamily protein